VVPSLSKTLDERQDEYYVCTAAEARALVQEYATRGIVDLARIKKTDALARWDKIEKAFTPVEAVAARGD
jgi:hypothetical protein